MDEFLDMNSLDSLRAMHESDEQWKLRRMFLERHMDNYPKNRLLCLAQIFCNMISLGCTYNPELMKTVREMGAGLCEMSKVNTFLEANKELQEFFEFGGLKLMQ
uniref:BMA-PAXT-1, isoform a n=1 Tax=Brugia malayi TaxID=6279 RepID=A0A0J9XU09_BRUMA|nr:BMA-PAXT-1, isoform a [Brugia malayi]